MKITIFTGSSFRHKFLVNSLINHKLYIICEDKKNFSFVKSKFFEKHKIVSDYFKKITKSEINLFTKSRLKKNKIIKYKKIKYNSLSSVKLKDIKDYLDSDLYIVFGSSYIKGPLLNFLVKNKCINIHMGVSPYYRGSNCNFWAIIDKNYHLVGSTIHRISKGLDDGDILYHSMVDPFDDPVDYSMAAIKSAVKSLTMKINDESILKLKPIKQKKKLEIRYAKNKDLSTEIFNQYPKKIKSKKINKKLLINPYVLMRKHIYD